MKFIISPAFLLKKIFDISKVIIKKPVISSLESFLFEIINKSLTIVASDLQNFAVSRFFINSNENISVLIPSYILINTLKVLPDKSVVFFIDENTVKIFSKNGKYKLSIKNSDDFPIISLQRSINLIKVSSLIFKKIIKNTIIASSSDGLKININGIYINVNQKRSIFVSTDGYRLIKYKRYDFIFKKKKSFIVSRRSFFLLNLFISNINVKNIEIEFNDNNIYFIVNNIILISKLIFEKYPNYKNVIPINSLYNLNISTNNLLFSLKRLLIYSDSDKFIKFKIRKNNLELLMKNLTNNYKALEKISCQYFGKSLNVNFNIKLLIELINIITSKKINLFFSNSTQSFVIKPINLPKYEDLLLLVMPVVLNE